MTTNSDNVFPQHYFLLKCAECGDDEVLSLKNEDGKWVCDQCSNKPVDSRGKITK